MCVTSVIRVKFFVRFITIKINIARTEEEAKLQEKGTVISTDDNQLDEDAVMDVFDEGVEAELGEEVNDANDDSSEASDNEKIESGEADDEEKKDEEKE